MSSLITAVRNSTLDLLDHLQTLIFLSRVPGCYPLRQSPLQMEDPRHRRALAAASQLGSQAV